MTKSWACCGHWTDQIYSPDSERLGRGHRRELIWVRYGNARESLAFVAFPREAHGVGLHHWPEVSLLQGLVS